MPPPRVPIRVEAVSSLTQSVQPPVTLSEDRGAVERDTLAELSLQDLQQIHLMSVANAATWQYARALQESSFLSAETDAVKQIHALTCCVEAARKAEGSARAKARSVKGKQLLQAALSVQVRVYPRVSACPYVVIV